MQARAFIPFAIGGLTALSAGPGLAETRTGGAGLALGGAQTHRLPNGVTVIIAEDRSVPLVSIAAVHPVGSRDDPPDRPGLAHLLEHVLALGSDVTAASGAPPVPLHATTSLDTTNYRTEVIPGNEDVALWNVALRLRAFDHPQRIDKLLPRARDTGRHEELQKRNQPGSDLAEFATEALFPKGHPYHAAHRSELGTLATATREELRAFHARHYRPDSTVIAVVGDVNAADILASAERYLGGLPGQPGWQRRNPATPPITPGRVTVEANIGRPRLMLLYAAPALFAPGYADLAMLPWLLEGPAGRLSSRLIRERRLVSSLDVSLDSRQLGSAFWIVVEPGQTPPETVLAAIDEELARAASSISTQDLARVQARAALDRTRRWESVSSRAVWLAESYALTGSARAMLEFTGQQVSTNPERLRAALAGLHPDNRVVAWLKPHPAAPLAGRLVGESLRAAPVVVVSGRPPALAPTPPGPVLAIPRPIVDSRYGVTPADPPIVTAVLDNGLRLLLSPRRQLGRLDATLIIGAGDATVDPADGGLAEAAAVLLLKGTRRRSAAAFAIETANAGIDLGAGTDWDMAEIQLETITSQADKAMGLLAEAVREPAYPEQELEVWRERRRRAWDEWAVTPYYIADAVLAGHLYPAGSPYAQPATCTPRSLARLSSAGLREFHQRAYHPGNATLVIVGDLPAERLRQLAERHFGDWPRQPRDELVPPQVPTRDRQDPRLLLVDIPGAPHAAIAMGAAAPAATLAEQSLGWMVARQLDSSIDWALAGQALAYSASTTFATSRGMQQFTVRTSVQPERADEAIRIIRADIATTRDGLPVRFGSRREGMILDLARQLGTFDGVEWLLRAALHNEVPGPMAARLKAYNSALPDEVRAFAHSRLSPERLVTVVAGDARRIGPALARLGAVSRVPNPFVAATER